jgi:hypothetical protein
MRGARFARGNSYFITHTFYLPAAPHPNPLPLGEVVYSILSKEASSLPRIVAGSIVRKGPAQPFVIMRLSPYEFK